MEHALLDGTSTNPLKSFLIEGVKEEQDFIARQKDGQNGVTAGPMEWLPVITDSVIDGRVSAIQRDFEARTPLYTFEGFTLSSVSEALFRNAKIAPKAGVQLAIQLASQRFFGYHPSSVETVSLTHYHHGRSAVTQTLWPAVVDFCSFYTDHNATEDQHRELFIAAAATLTNRLARAFQSGAFFRYMLALQGLLEDGDEVPSLFSDDVYKRSQRPILTTDCLDTDVFESGIVLEPPGSIWIHYQVLKESVVFSIWGHDADLTEFRRQLDIAIMDIKTLLRE
ncbi:conserved hypothetical protein [Talaromyces stipitatus ATCC 10500]|uniref:Choline/carnitine acyltransferase domain-containing protein n=1 Tax=Talaromyces stipitatus (strain ATCC 10500 / CBS 375.48 / QM 6759 / NRRL 1006) TaxID=441959 RepID=B8MHG9_TALSN|nr:uncharacterized protein TSTA_022050 [Talaromyces stipitatus ATCC 10500]EED17148.1 conserved hypothetical protein [Talaromyces stipitatus ATCC 10500]